jgi:hypothetical protein
MFKFGGRLCLCTLRFLIPLYCISCHIVDNVSFKFGGVDKHYLSVCLFACFVCFVCVCVYIYIYNCFATLLIVHDLHHNYGLCVIGMFLNIAYH